MHPRGHLRSDRGSLSRSTPEPQAALVLLDRAQLAAPAAGHRPAVRSSIYMQG